MTDSSPVVDGLVVKDFGTYGIYATGGNTSADLKNVTVSQMKAQYLGTGQWPLF